MGRLAKKGLEYFPMDTDVFQDIRIRKLIKYQGGDAVTVYTLLLCLIYKDGYYLKWDKEVPFIVSELTGLEENHIAEVIKCCLAVGLFDKQIYDKEGVLTSRSIQQRYCNIKQLNKRLARIEEYCLIDVQHLTGKSSAKKTRPAANRRQQATVEPEGKKDPQTSGATQKDAATNSEISSVNAKYLQAFFSEKRAHALVTLCKNLGLHASDLLELREIAEAIITEWELAEVTHVDFSDWSKHLISTMRIRISERKKQKKELRVPTDSTKSSSKKSEKRTPVDTGPPATLEQIQEALKNAPWNTTTQTPNHQP